MLWACLFRSPSYFGIKLRTKISGLYFFLREDRAIILFQRALSLGNFSRAKGQDQGQATEAVTNIKKLKIQVVSATKILES